MLNRMACCRALQAEEHMNAAKAAYDQLSNELVVVSGKIKQKHTLVLQLSLLNYLRALHAHFRQGFNMMETLDGFMGELQHSVTALQESGLNVDDQSMYQTPDAAAAAAAGAGGAAMPPPSDSAPPPSYGDGSSLASLHAPSIRRSPLTARVCVRLSQEPLHRTTRSCT